VAWAVADATTQGHPRLRCCGLQRPKRVTGVARHTVLRGEHVTGTQGRGSERRPPERGGPAGVARSLDLTLRVWEPFPTSPPGVVLSCDVLREPSQAGERPILASTSPARCLPCLSSCRPMAGPDLRTFVPQLPESGRSRRSARPHRPHSRSSLLVGQGGIAWRTLRPAPSLHADYRTLEKKD
jgi:hypothetical protein